jgi:hypothetical protein
MQFKQFIGLTIICSLLCFVDLKAQTHHYIQYSGIISSIEGEPMVFVSVYNVNTFHQTTTDKNGLYNIVVRNNDTIVFSCIGHRNTMKIIPDSIHRNTYSEDIAMVPDTFILNMVTIFPWRNYYDFRQAVLKRSIVMKDEDEQFKKNLIIMQNQALRNHKATPEEKAMQFKREQFIRAQNLDGIAPTYPIFNPKNWIDFVGIVRDGSLWKSEDIK